MNLVAQSIEEECANEQEKEAGEEQRNRQLILKRLRAALLQSYKGAAWRKNGLCEGSAWGNWDPQKNQQPF